MARFLASLIAVGLCLSANAQKLGVTVVDRQDNETDYSYVVPGHFSSYSNASVNCSDNSYSVNCNGNGATQGFSTPSHFVPFQVRGATLTLLLPDGRLAVVNCESKFAERMAGPRGNHRSCRVPLVREIDADFHGGKAKLEWNVSIDGKKKESETYKVLAVFDRPTGAGAPQGTANSATARSDTQTQNEKAVGSMPPAASGTGSSAMQGRAALLDIDSTPSGADIELDGNFVGDTPSSVPVAFGTHEITVKKKGFQAWSRKMSFGGGNVHLNAELDKEN